MRLSAIPRFLLVALLCPLLSVAAESGSRSFIERVRPNDYYDVEKLFPEAFSHTHELVMLRTTAAEPVSVFAIKRNVDREGYTLVLQLASAEVPEGWLKISEDLDVTLGQQVLRAIELKLHRQVTLSKFKRIVSKTDSDLWVYQVRSDGKTAAALIAMEATIDNPAASLFLEDFIGSLEKLIGREGDERAVLLQKIDRISTDIILAETP